MPTADSDAIRPTTATTAPPGPARRVTLALLVAALLATPVSTAPSPAHADADGSLEAALVRLVNDERRANGLPALSTEPGLTSTARSWSAGMDEQRNLHHNPRLGTAVHDWQRVGENVGRGPDLDALHEAFVTSPEHRRNLLDPAWSEIGIGVIVSDDTLWVTQLFRLPTD